MEIAGSILLAYVAYLPAEEIHASGVLAAVTAGLYLGWHSSSGAFSARSRLQSNAFWETLVFLVNAALFVLVGLSFHTFTV
jgi:CPA1 family monovalent cation:H+ antiporter